MSDYINSLKMQNQTQEEFEKKKKNEYFLKQRGHAMENITKAQKFKLDQKVQLEDEKRQYSPIN